MAEQKVYEPETIVDNALPLASSPASSVTESAQSGGVISTRKIKDSPIPRYIARETISQTLNTKSRKILAEFQFTESGAIQIGKYVYALSGDLRISPAGIIARNSNGDITFALDGDTGDATFRGIVQAQDFQLVGGGIIGVATSGTRSQAGFNDIQDAIDWVYSMGGGRVIVPTGRHLISENIVLYSNITLEGEDPDLTVLDFQGNFLAYPNNQIHITMMGTSGSHITNCNITNITITNCALFDFGVIQVQYADWCKITNVRVVDCTYPDDPITYAVFVENSTYVEIYNCVFDNPDRGVYLYVSDYCKIEKSSFKDIDTGNGVVYLITSKFFIFRDNTVDNCGASAADTDFYIGDNSPEFLIDNNYFNNCHSAITIWGETATNSYNGKIINNRFIGDSNSPFSSGSDSAINISNSYGLSILNNRISNYQFNGVIIYDSSSGIVSANVIDNIGSIAVEFSGNSDKNTIVGNSLSAATDGIKLGVGSDYNIVNGNQFYGKSYTNSGTGNVFANNVDV